MSDQQIDPRAVLHNMIEKTKAEIAVNRELFDGLEGYPQQIVAFEIGKALTSLETLENFQKLMGW